MNESYFPPRLSGFFVFLLIFVVIIASTTLIFFRPAPSPSSSFSPIQSSTTPSVTPLPTRTITPRPGIRQLRSHFDTSGWKTYSSADFTFKYPPEWIPGISYSGFSAPERGKVLEFIGGGLRNDPRCFPYYQDRPGDQGVFISLQTISASGYPGELLIERVVTGPTGKKWFPHEYCLSDNDRSFTFVLYTYTLDSPDVRVYDTILSTFKFTQ